MKSFAQALDLKDDPGLIRQYLELHKRVWPEVERALLEIGITKMRLYRLGSRLFMYCEARDDFDPVCDYQRYASDPRCAEWDALMRQFQRPAPGTRAGEWWAGMEPVYELDREPARD